MPALRELQSGMAAAIRSAAARENLSVQPVPGIAQPERLALHARNFRAGLTSALASIFPGTRRLTGEGFFAFAAAQFITSAPPRDPIVAHYGAGFPSFLAAMAGLEKSAWIADAARLEWTIQALSDRPPTAPLDLSTLGRASDARFDWSQSATLFAAPVPAADLIDPDVDLASLDLSSPCYLLLTAGEDGVIQNDITASASGFLQALQSGQSLSAALEDNPPSTQFDPAATLRLAARTGCFAAINPIEEPAS